MARFSSASSFDIPASAAALVAAARQADDGAALPPVVLANACTASEQGLQLGLRDYPRESPLKAVNPVGMLYGKSLHLLSFQLLRVKSDNICKPAPEINAQTVFSAWFQARLLTAIAEGPRESFVLMLQEAANGGRLEHSFMDEPNCRMEVSQIAEQKRDKLPNGT